MNLLTMLLSPHNLLIGGLGVLVTACACAWTWWIMRDDDDYIPPHLDEQGLPEPRKKK